MIVTLILGLFVGVVAKLLMPGRDPGGWIITIVLGIAGAWLASWAGAAGGFYMPGEPVGFIAAVMGAIVILILYRVLTK
jgi:uncharacterized membrane protein YeaQ/YmgE (transglycosylase-associated protein family)